MHNEFIVKSVHKPFKYHVEVKEPLLHAINNSADVEDLRELDITDGSSISRLDFNNAFDQERPWVDILFDKLMEHFNESAQELGFFDSEIKQLWFQQYEQNDTHRWHSHGFNYTGVYYLEFPPGSPSTEILDHNDNLHIVDAKEGDIIIFPSVLVHRAPPVKHQLRKTIISFNIEIYKEPPEEEVY